MWGMCKGRAEHRPETAQVSANHPICHIQTRGGLDDLAPPCLDMTNWLGRPWMAPPALARGTAGVPNIYRSHMMVWGALPRVPQTVWTEIRYLWEARHGGGHILRQDSSRGLPGDRWWCETISINILNHPRSQTARETVPKIGIVSDYHCSTDVTSLLPKGLRIAVRHSRGSFVNVGDPLQASAI